MTDLPTTVKDDAEAQVKRLAKKFQFHPTCTLADKLANIERRYNKHQGMIRSSWAQRRKAAEAVNKHVSALLESLPELDRAAGGCMVRTELRESLVELREKTAEAVSKLTGKRGGGPKRDDARHILVMDLYQLYRCWTGNTHRYTAHEWAPDGPTHSGPFIDFALEAAELLNVELIPSFIAQTLKEANLSEKDAS